MRKSCFFIAAVLISMAFVGSCANIECLPECTSGCQPQPYSYPAHPVAAVPDTRGIYWIANHESNDFSEWYLNQNGKAIFNTGAPAKANITPSAAAARTGKYGLSLELNGIDRSKLACRIFRWGEYLTEGYFSGWIMFPSLPDIGSGWLNIWQIKKKNTCGFEDPTYYHELKNVNGKTFLALSNWHVQYCIPPYPDMSGLQEPEIRAGEWYHIEWYYKDGVTDGALTIWVNDTRYWEFTGIDTRGSSPQIFWLPSLYGELLTSSSVNYYLDDCIISDHRVGMAFDALQYSQ